MRQTEKRDMRSSGSKDVWVAGGVMGTMTFLLVTPKSFVVGLAAALGISQKKIDSYVAMALDRLLAEDCVRLPKSLGRNVLDFPTSAFIRGVRFGIGWQRVKVVRTIRERIRGGYRIKIRAFAEGARKRIIVRTAEVDLHGTA